MRTEPQLWALQALQMLGREASPGQVFHKVRENHPDLPPQNIRWAMWQLCRDGDIEFVAPDTISIRDTAEFEMPSGELNGDD